mmetsp:Transcript_5371/g.14677  ORF Transcript_5371/g.14677 Transcript_5371/m.14677 type:complete len:416 (+) Transcript_5371:81-1328(+)
MWGPALLVPVIRHALLLQRPVALAIRADMVEGGEKAAPGDGARMPGLLEAFCNGNGLAYSVSLGDFAPVDALAVACEDGDIRALSALLDPGLAHRDPALRRNATLALGRWAAALAESHDERAGDFVGGIEVALADRAPSVRELAVEVLAQVSARAYRAAEGVAERCVVALSERALKDREIVVRSRAVGGVATEAGGELPARCVAALTRAIVSDKALDVRRTAVRMLGTVASSHADADIVSSCITALGERALSDRTFSIRALGAEVLGTVAISVYGSHPNLAAQCIAALSEHALDDVGYISRIVHSQRVTSKTAFSILGDVTMGTMGGPGSLAGNCVSLLARRGFAHSDAIVRAHTAEILGRVAVSAHGVAKELAARCLDMLTAQAQEEKSRLVREACAEALRSARAIGEPSKEEA